MAVMIVSGSVAHLPILQCSEHGTVNRTGQNNWGLWSGPDMTEQPWLMVRTRHDRTAQADGQDQT